MILSQNGMHELIQRLGMHIALEIHGSPEATELLDRNMLTIKTLVAMCPLIGLLGTVTGMISVFETMAQQGTGNPRLMASGISMATIPTMAGMVAALSGVFFSSRLDAKVKLAKAKLIDSLPHH